MNLTKQIVNAAATDCDGSAIPSSETDYAYTTYAAYGEPDTATVTTSLSGTASTTSTTTYTRNIVTSGSSWLFQLTEAKVRNVKGASDITRTTDFGYFTGTNLLQTLTQEPSIPALNVVTTFTLDDFGNRLSASVVGSGMAARASSATYDAQGRFALTATDPKGHTTTFTWNADHGTLATRKDANLQVTSFAYDALGRQDWRADPNGTKHTFNFNYCAPYDGSTTACAAGVSYYHSNGNYGAVSGNAAPARTISYDMLGRPVARLTQSFDGNWDQIDVQYDAAGNVLQTNRPYNPGAGGGAYWTRYTYDDLRRVKTATAPNSGVATTVYAGTTTTTTDPLSHATAATIDADGEVATVTDAASHATHYAYDAFGDLLGATDPAGNVVAATYDSRGRKLTSSDPDMGAWSYGYDPLGELTSQVDPANGAAHPTTLSYDADGRVIERVEGTTASYTDWVYDGAAHGVGLLQASCTSAASNPTCTAPLTAKTFAYDTLSRPASTTIAVDGSSYTYTTAYDANIGQLGTVSYPSGFVAAYGYTSLGYLASVKDNASGTALTTVNSANPAMQVTAATAGNGVTTTSTYDATTGLLTNLRAGASDAVAAFDYSYDVVGDLTYRSDDNQSVFEKFCYDGLNRLTDAATAATAPTACTSTGTGITTKTVAYDTLGDITNKNDVGAYSYPASGSARPHAVASITGTVNGVTNPTYGYDANGNMTSGAGRTMTYTAFNMAASIVQGTTDTCLSYDADHMRIKMAVYSSTACTGTATSTTTYLSDPISGAMSEKVVSGATTWHDYVAGAERFCTGAAPCTSGATFKYFVTDHLGSIAVIIDATGAVSERLSYDAWGRRRNANGTDNASCSITSATSRGYTGHEMLDSLCEINANARIYDPTLGRFMSPGTFVQRRSMDSPSNATAMYSTTRSAVSTPRV